MASLFLAINACYKRAIVEKNASVPSIRRFIVTVTFSVRTHLNHAGSRRTTARECCMRAFPFPGKIFLSSLLALTLCAGCNAATKGPVPASTADDPLAKASAKQTAVFAGGCFWGVQAVFEHVKGIRSATSGYAGGFVKNPSYEAVS